MYLLSTSKDGEQYSPRTGNVPPFRVRILNAQTNEHPDASQPGNAYLGSLLPASYRTDEDDLAPPKLGNINYIEKELGVGRLSQRSGLL
jgi:hypothetical protein